MRSIPLRTAWKIIYWNVVLAVLIVSFGSLRFLRRDHQYDRLIADVCRAQGVNPRLVSALVWEESRFKPRCVGKAGEIGLMQVTSVAAGDWARAQNNRAFSRNDLFNPETNLQAGTWYLARAIRYWSRVYPDPLPAALAEYNAGRSNAQRWAVGCSNSRTFWEGISYPTTKRYIHNILKRYRGKV